MLCNFHIICKRKSIRFFIGLLQWKPAQLFSVIALVCSWHFCVLNVQARLPVRIFSASLGVCCGLLRPLQHSVTCLNCRHIKTCERPWPVVTVAYRTVCLCSDELHSACFIVFCLAVWNCAVVIVQRINLLVIADLFVVCVGYCRKCRKVL